MHGGDGVQVRHVERERQRRGARRSGGRRGVLDLYRRARRHRDAEAVLGQAQGDGASDAPATTRDERDARLHADRLGALGAEENEHGPRIGFVGLAQTVRAARPGPSLIAGCTAAQRREDESEDDHAPFHVGH